MPSDPAAATIPTVWVRFCGGAARDTVGTGRFEHVERDHGRAGIQTPDALVREALHRRLAEGEETGDGPLSRR